MLELDQKPVPEPILLAFQDTLDQVPAKLLVEYARPRADLMKGLSPRPDSAPVLRKRLKALLTAKRQPDTEILDLIRETGLFGQFIVVLSDKALAHGFGEFCAFFGEPAFLAGLLLDHREGIRAIAWEHLKAHPLADGFRDVTAEAAQATLEADFGPFLGRLASLKAKLAAAPGGQPADPAELVQLREKVKRFEEQAKREDRAAEKDKTVLAREREQFRAKTEELEARLREQKARIAEADARARAAEQTLADSQGDLHRRLREGVEAELSAETRRWLLPLRAMETAAHSHKATANLLNDVRDALRQQSERDRAMGNRQDLHKRLDTLRQSRDEVREALKNALNRHPRLADLADALDREIESLAALLGEPAWSGSAENALLARVNAAQSVAELDAVRAFLEGDAKAFTLFPPGFAPELNRRMTDKRNQILQGLIPPGAAASPQAPADRLRHVLSLPLTRVLLLVDGHNLLLSRPDLFRGVLENGQPGARAREALADRLAAALETARDCDLRLYFDGPERSESDRTPRLKVIYSGGGARDQRADNAIVQDLEFYAPRYEGCYVITDDAELLSRASRPGVQGRSLNQLADLLG